MIIDIVDVKLFDNKSFICLMEFYRFILLYNVLVYYINLIYCFMLLCKVKVID